MQSQSGNDGDDLIPIESLESIMTDFSLIIGAVFMQYDTYMKGEAAKKNDPKAIQKFIEYVKAKLLAQGGDGKLIRDSVIGNVQKKDKTEKKIAPTNATTQSMFSRDFFMYHIDKFFSKELSVVLHPIDDEYAKFLALEKKDQDDFEREIEDLDEYFLNDQDQNPNHKAEPELES